MRESCNGEGSQRDQELRESCNGEGFPQGESSESGSGVVFGFFPQGESSESGSGVVFGFFRELLQAHTDPTWH
ncbi:hypothetical protein AWY89_11145 [Pasteurella multocida subsp. multocida]|nr:hypothetical protein AWY89_11145 [Pasteurella multocida subsp. multocida]